MASLHTALDAFIAGGLRRANRLSCRFVSLVFLRLTSTCSLRPSPCLQPQGQALGATLRAAVAVQIVCPDDLSLNHSYGYAFGPRIKYGAGSGTHWRTNLPGADLDVRRAPAGCAPWKAHIKKSGAIIVSPGEKSGLEEKSWQPADTKTRIMNLVERGRQVI